MKKFTKIITLLFTLNCFLAVTTFAQLDFNESLIIPQPEIENLIGLQINELSGDVVPIKSNLENNDPSYIKNSNSQNSSMFDVSNLNGSIKNGTAVKNPTGDDDMGNEPEREELLIRSKSEIEIIYNDPNIKLYPNPAKDFVNFNLTTTEFSKVEIYDLIGNKVFNLELDEFSETKINLFNLNSGIYMIQFIGDNKISSKKIAIKK